MIEMMNNYLLLAVPIKQKQRQKNYTTSRMTNCSIYGTLINNLKPMIYQERISNYLNNVFCIIL